jgi:hypothetical protein
VFDRVRADVSTSKIVVGIPVNDVAFWNCKYENSLGSSPLEIYVTLLPKSVVNLDANSSPVYDVSKELLITFLYVCCSVVSIVVGVTTES